MVGKRSIESRIESVENNPALDEDPTPKGEAFREVRETIDEEHGEGATNEALLEVFARLGGRQRGDYADVPSDLVENSVFENVDERGRCATILAEVVFSSSESAAGAGGDGGGGSALKRRPTRRAD